MRIAIRRFALSDFGRPTRLADRRSASVDSVRSEKSIESSGEEYAPLPTCAVRDGGLKGLLAMVELLLNNLRIYDNYIVEPMLESPFRDLC